MFRRRVEPSDLVVLVVGQTPPPVHGQAVMIKRLVESDMGGIRIHHVRMALSDELADVGTLRVGKLGRLAMLLIRIVWHVLAERPAVLYYPPAGPNRIPMWRDYLILGSVRWMIPKTVFHFHASDVSSRYESLGRLERWLFRRAYFYADGAVQISMLAPPDGQKLQARSVFIVPNGIEDPWEGKPPQRTNKESIEPTRLLYVGMIHAGKGVGDLLEAVRREVHSGQNLVLDVVGAPADLAFMGDLEEKVLNEGLESRVRFWGPLDGPAKWDRFASADVLVHPSSYDTSPTVIIEAMASALPVVSTRHAGIPELVEEGETGFLHPAGDIDALASLLRRLSEDHAERRRLGASGRSRFEASYTIDRHIAGLREALAQVGRDRT